MNINFYYDITYICEKFIAYSANNDQQWKLIRDWKKHHERKKSGHLSLKTLRLE